MDTPTIPGLHHLTAIAGEAQRNLDFYAGVLGLRLVKITVNFDDPGSYHLYYGDAQGSPGTILTFFPWAGAPRGMQGAGQVTATALAVPASAISFWHERLAAHGIPLQQSPERFGEPVLAFADPDGLPLELIGSSTARVAHFWAEGGVPEEAAIAGMHGVTLLERTAAATEALLTETLGFRRLGQEGERTRYAIGEGGVGATADLLVDPAAPRGRNAAGTVHHVAWRTPSDEQQLAWERLLSARRLGVTPVQDRQYFRSIYFREPGGVLFEIATDPPGFATDESVAELGTALRLPPWLESERARILRLLPPLRLPARPAR